MEKSKKVKLSILTLVYPPISNQEAESIYSQKEVEEAMRQSDFYMIGGRSEILFTNMEYDKDCGVISFVVSLDDAVSDKVEIWLWDLPGVRNAQPESLAIEFGSKIVRIWNAPERGPEPLAWFTTEKLLWNRWRGTTGIKGLSKLRELATYDLLYVGIAKVGDSYDRLIANGHKARTTILAKEKQRRAGARVSDETYIFLFKIEPLIISVIEPDDQINGEDVFAAVDSKRIVADAEKAFVSLLKPEYNITRFKQYPMGTDGLYGHKYARYSYVIGEVITFRTPHGVIVGSYDAESEFIDNDADAIFVDGETVTLKSASGL